MDVAFLTETTKEAQFSTIQKWHESGQILILSYGELASLIFNDQFSEPQRTTLDKHLKTPGPHIVVCDEGHLLKNEKTRNFKVISLTHTLNSYLFGTVTEKYMFSVQ